MNSSEGNTEIGSGVQIRWADVVADHDYSAAEAYLAVRGRRRLSYAMASNPK